MQFNIPIGSYNLIIELFEILKKRNQINDFIILPFQNAEPIFTTPNLDHWNATTNKWKFNWDEWFSDQVKKRTRKELSSQQPGIVKEWLTQAYIGIIHHLGKNARRKNTEIMDDLKKDNFEFTPQTFSRHIKRVKKYCIKDYRVYLTPTIFDLYSTVLIWGSANKDILQDLESRIIQKPIPFSSTFKTKGENLFWYLHLPPSHLSNLLFNLRKKLIDMRFNYIDYNRATSFLPWPPTFDETKKDWKIDRDFLITDVIKELD
ncbi:MAG: hypothetical protein JXA54_15385 [Candidatus Heimdallarchaeota archaeon]|nr:hypothetical protein [Candidatus Heimdallarchaeota archaeon]